MTATKTTTIVEKLKRVMALTTSGNPNEAAAASAKLQELLLKHNLSLADISGAPINGRERVYGNHRVTVAQSEAKRSLLAVLAKYNFCHFVYMQGAGYGFMVGEEHNVQAVLAMADWVNEQLDHLVWRGYNEYKVAQAEKHGAYFNADWHVEPPRTWKKAFRIGAIYTIRKRLQEAADAAKVADATTNALVVVTGKELKEAFERFHPYTTTGKASKVSSSGYAAGERAGHSVALGAKNSLGKGN